MKKILVLGCPGSGKSTLSRRLGPLLDIPVVHMDKLFWTPGWVSILRDALIRKLEAELRKDSWVIDGNFSATLPMRLEAADTAIYLDHSSLSCVLRVLRRVLTSLGRVRPDMGEGCPERFDLAFLRFVWSFRKTHRADMLRALDAFKANGGKVILLKNDRETEAFLKSLQA